jgi:hypothetical protein
MFKLQDTVSIDAMLISQIDGTRSNEKALTHFWCVYGGSAAVAETLYVFLHEDKPAGTGEGHTSHHLRHNMHTKPGNRSAIAPLYHLCFPPFLE